LYRSVSGYNEELFELVNKVNIVKLVNIFSSLENCLPGLHPQICVDPEGVFYKRNFTEAWGFFNGQLFSEYFLGVATLVIKKIAITITLTLPSVSKTNNAPTNAGCNFIDKIM